MTRRRGRWRLRALMLARHWGFAVLLGCGAALRAAAMAGYRPALVFIDTPRYLMDYAIGIDPLGYRYLFTDPLLALHTGLTGLVAVQHLLGLAMGAAVYVLVLRYGAPRWLGVLAAAPVLLDAYQVQAEQLILSDVLFEALLCAALLILAWPPVGHRTVARVAAAALVLGAATTVRQVGELALIPLLAYALLAGRKPDPDAPPAGKGRRTRAALALAGVVGFAVPVLTYMTYSATVLGAGFQLTRVDSTYLYARLANAADCATLRLPSSERPLCPASPVPGIDALANSPASPIRTYDSRLVSLGSAVNRFDLAVVTQQPLRVADAVTRDAVKLFALTRDGDPGDPPIADSQFQRSYPVYQPAYGAAFDGPHEAKPRTNRAIDSALRDYQLYGGYAPGPLLLAFALLSAFGALSARVPRRLRAGAAVAAGLALAVVGGADFYEFTWRYQLPALLLLPPGGALGALALAGTVRRITLAPQTRRDQAIPAHEPVPVPVVSRKS